MNFSPPRAEPRYEVDAHVGLNSDPEPQKVRNMSLGGVCIETPNVQEVGTVVELEIHFPDLGSSMSIKGKVMWVNREPPTDMGVRFLDLDDEKRATLREFLRRVVIAPTPSSI